MSAPTTGVNIANPTSRQHYDVKWGGTDLGLTDEVDLTKFKFKGEVIATATTGKGVPLGYRITGYEGGPSVVLRQLSQSMYAYLAPWSNGSSGVATMPPLNVDLYAYAQPLVFHPIGAADLTTDVTFPLACPMTAPRHAQVGQRQGRRVARRIYGLPEPGDAGDDAAGGQPGHARPVTAAAVNPTQPDPEPEGRP